MRLGKVEYEEEAENGVLDAVAAIVNRGYLPTLCDGHDFMVSEEELLFYPYALPFCS